MIEALCPTACIRTDRPDHTLRLHPIQSEIRSEVAHVQIDWCVQVVRHTDTTQLNITPRGFNNVQECPPAEPGKVAHKIESRPPIEHMNE
jgi:hypothetical protein